MTIPMDDGVFRSKGCFVCGTDNPGGLDLAPHKEGEKVVLTFVPKKEHLGFSKAVHGGITASLLDEVVGVACGQRTDGKCATVELTVSYKRPLLEGLKVRAEGWYVRRSGRLVLGRGQILDEQGRVLATARGRFLPLEERHVKTFVGT
jgi:uncharacterized protein (TIGR00369 family)